MITTFTPCLNFITGSSSNGSSPTQDCCGSLRSLISRSMDCACLIIAANIPFQLPVNRTLALGLPRACNMAGVPVQCKASGTPLPAPGPVPFLLSPTLPPTAAAASPLSPEPDLTPAAPPKEEEEEEEEAPSPTVNPRIRSVLQPTTSSANPSYIYPPSLLVALIGITIFKLY
ncbi:hypothetical protein V6N12_022777 [Hibiscus sabdariffa]|uniref:Bifunctional inhibitor/plant lipid transfer protein/seed storage helical domain-containing protein n=1 Tax=Hibiscus sabdariffa TaxID=183260 RepID=A0ABR2FWH7_9ROSI